MQQSYDPARVMAITETRGWRGPARRDLLEREHFEDLTAD
jgi:hypothetical protein